MASKVARRILLGAALALPAVRAARAEASEAFISKQSGTLHIQQDVMEGQRLVEKHGALLGLANLCASFIRFSGTGPITEARLFRSLHYTSGGLPGALAL